MRRELLLQTCIHRMIAQAGEYIEQTDQQEDRADNDAYRGRLEHDDLYTGKA